MICDLVIVTYNPNVFKFNELLVSIQGQVDNIFIIDNNSNDFNISSQQDKIHFLKLDSNVGVARAQNIGIKLSISKGSGFVVLSDQDTIYPSDYVKNMTETFDLCDSFGVISPLFNDISSDMGLFGFDIPGKFFWKREFPKKKLNMLNHSIASGMVIRSSLFINVGFFNEELFIDWVDFEWCWRVRRNNYYIVGNAEVIINHTLGDRFVNFLNKRITVKENVDRYYYITRNSFFLALFSKHLPVFYRLILFLSSFKYLIIYPFISGSFLKTLKRVIIGFVHGIKGRLGPY